MNAIKRAKAPTPKFFKVLRNIGLTLAAVGGTVLAAPIALPVVVTSVEVIWRLLEVLFQRLVN